MTYLDPNQLKLLKKTTPVWTSRFSELLPIFCLTIASINSNSLILASELSLQHVTKPRFVENVQNMPVFGIKAVWPLENPTK